MRINNFYPYVNFDNASIANKFEDMYVCVTFIHMLMSRETFANSCEGKENLHFIRVFFDLLMLIHLIFFCRF